MPAPVFNPPATWSGTSTNSTDTVSGAIPEGIPVGEVIFAFLAWGTVSPSTAANIGTVKTIPPGWTLLGTWVGVNSGAGWQTAILTRVATAADAAASSTSPVSYTFAVTNMGTFRLSVGYAVWDNVDITNPIAKRVDGSLAAVFAYLTSGSTARPTGTLVTEKAGVLVTVAGDRAGSNYSAPAGNTDVERIDYLNTNTSLAVYDSNAEVPAGSYTRTLTASLSSSSGAQLLFQLNSRVIAPVVYDTMVVGGVEVPITWEVV